MAKNTSTFLDSFPGHKYRYIDQATGSRVPVSSAELRNDLNVAGYEAYFTVNGFSGLDNRREQCNSLNAFFIDIDGRKDAREIAKIKKLLDPTYIIETRNGFHVYWLLDEPIYREEVSAEAWGEAIKHWEQIEQNIVTTLNADPSVKDLTRILRQPDTYYWKKSGDAYKRGVEAAPFKIKGQYKKPANTYSMEQVSDAFPMPVDTVAPFPKTPKGETMARYAEAEKSDFFNRVNEKYPIENRPSFQALISGAEGTLPPNIVSRNMALLITGTLMRQAGWNKNDAIEHIKKVGWHGIEKERGGITEIQNTIHSAFGGAYTYSYKNDIIAFNMTPQEQVLIQSAYTAVQKDRRELEKARFANYEYELFSRYPHLKKNEIGMIFNYNDGVYRMLNDMEISNIIMMALYEDMLWGYRTKRNIADKVATLLSIIPDLVLTPDNGDIFNCKNGLLKLSTKELLAHTADFVSLVQSPAAYDPSAIATTWMDCMHAWMEGEEEEKKTLLLQQFAGYLLSSSMEYSKALFLVGDGGNGKSTFADTLGMVLGNVATSRIDLEDLYSTFGLAGLIGKRLNIVEEVSGNYYQSHKLKKLVSGEELTINMKFKDQFKFKPEAKFIFAVNTMPRVDDSSSATERRIAAVVFSNNWRNNPNTALRSSTGALALELSGILNWMIEGLVKLRAAKRFMVTDEQKAVLKEYRAENSSVEGFITECVDFVEGKLATARELYEEYKDYCQKDGRKFKAMIAFTKEMKDYGKRNGLFSFRERENGHAPAVFEGVSIVNEWNQDTNYRMNRILEKAQVVSNDDF